jgi:predicted polyphosphate/ATP-dependent NAD kinase
MVITDVDVPTVGLIVNPIAGIGGSTGLKGTDGPEILEEALRRGGRPIAPDRSIRALDAMRQKVTRLKLITCPAKMGEEEAIAAGVPYELLDVPVRERTTAFDTRVAAKQLEARVKLLLFAGGDGTAHDVADAVDCRVAVLGIPCGVKNYSGVFASSPEAVGEVVALFMRGEIETVESEVMDLEDSMRKGRIETRICGVLRVPSSRRFVQSAKSTTLASERSEQDAIAKFVVEHMNPRFQYILGPGSSTSKIAERLGVDKTLLGVDVIFEGKLVAKDVAECDLEEIVQKHSTKLIIAPIGGGGHILGRGNQQLTPSVIRAIGKEDIIVICTRTKLVNLPERRLLVDTGDKSLDRELIGYWRIVVGYREFSIVKVE